MYFLKLFLIYAFLHNIFFLLFYSMNFICVDFNYKLILTSKFIIHIQVNEQCCDIKYFNSYWSLKFLELHLYLSFMIFL